MELSLHQGRRAGSPGQARADPTRRSFLYERRYGLAANHDDSRDGMGVLIRTLDPFLFFHDTLPQAFEKTIVIVGSLFTDPGFHLGIRVVTVAQRPPGLKRCSEQPGRRRDVEQVRIDVQRAAESLWTA